MSDAAKVMPMPPKRGVQKEYFIDWRKPEEKAHPPVEISVGQQDSILWWCEKKFRVLSVHPDYVRSRDAPAKLFYREFPEDNRDFSFQVNSGPARPGTENNYYKPVFEFEDRSIPVLDPHIHTTA
jgi:hypothetical protein